MNKFSGSSSFEDLAKAALSRHGIAKQVHASMLVKTARELFADHIDTRFHPLFEVISFKQGVLRIFLRTPHAKQLISKVQSDILHELAKRYPQTEVKRISLTFHR